MSKYAVQALVKAAAEDSDLKEVLESGKGSIFNHVANSILSLTADEAGEIKKMLNKSDDKKSVLGKAEERNNPGPGSGSGSTGNAFRI